MNRKGVYQYMELKEPFEDCLPMYTFSNGAKSATFIRIEPKKTFDDRMLCVSINKDIRLTVSRRNNEDIRVSISGLVLGEDPTFNRSLPYSETFKMSEEAASKLCAALQALIGSARCGKKDE